jgi:peptide/nickel transport system permease protein/oligopeptide transport system permease protein
MLGYIARRLMLTIPVVVGILLVTFMIKSLIPTDAVTAMYQGQFTEQEAAKSIAIIRHKFHLDQPWYTQFYYYASGVLHGDLGTSIRTRRPVLDEIGFRYVKTLQLAFAALLVALVIGVLSGVIAAYRRDSWIDVTATTISLFGISMPAFFFGLLVILVFSVWLHWLPVIPHGWTGLLLPAFTLGLIEAAPLARITRSSMLDVLGRDYIRAGRARGLSERVVLFRHALPNTLLAVTTIVGLQIGHLLGGAFIIEIIFGWRGIGELAVRAITWRDFAITQGVILIGSGSFVLINLAIDVLYTWIDPRIVYKSD